MGEHWNVASKDALLGRHFKTAVEQRIAREMAVTPDEYVPVRFTNNPDCVAAYKNALCWYNFPKCGNYNQSLPLCRSTCDNYFAACGFKGRGAPLYESCKDHAVEAMGLFKANLSGPEHQLADAELNCNGTPWISLESLEALDRAGDKDAFPYVLINPERPFLQIVIVAIVVL